MSESEKPTPVDASGDEPTEDNESPLRGDEILGIEEIFRRYVANADASPAQEEEVYGTPEIAELRRNAQTLQGIQDLEDAPDGLGERPVRVAARESADERFGVKASVVTSRRIDVDTTSGAAPHPAQHGTSETAGTMAGLPLRDIEALEAAALEHAEAHEQDDQLSEEWVNELDDDLREETSDGEGAQGRNAILRKPGGLSAARTLRQRLQSGEVETAAGADPESRYIRTESSARRGAASGSIPRVGAGPGTRDESGRTSRTADTVPDLEVDKDAALELETAAGAADADADATDASDSAPTSTEETLAVQEAETVPLPVSEPVPRPRVFEPDPTYDRGKESSRSTRKSGDDAPGVSELSLESQEIEDPFADELTGDDDLDELLFDDDERPARRKDPSLEQLRLADPHIDARGRKQDRKRAITGLYEGVEGPDEVRSTTRSAAIEPTGSLPRSVIIALCVGLLAAVLYVAWWLEMLPF